MPAIQPTQVKKLFFHLYCTKKLLIEKMDLGDWQEAIIRIINSSPDVVKDFIIKDFDWNHQCYRSLMHTALHSQNIALINAVFNHPSWRALDLKEKKKTLMSALVRTDLALLSDEFYKFIIPFCDTELLTKVKQLKINTIQKHFASKILSLKDFTPIFDSYYLRYPITDIWRLFCDSCYQNRQLGWHHFEEREPGYILAMTKALFWMRKTINTPLSIELIQCAHRVATQNVKGMLANSGAGLFRGANDHLAYDIGVSISLRDLIHSLRDSKRFSEFKLTLTNKNYMRYDLIAIESTQIANKTQNILNQYKQNIVNAKNANNYLLAIATMICRLEKLHPFVDGNTRTFSMLLLNRELIRHGFSPCMLSDANVSSVCCPERLTNEIASGMLVFQQCLKGNFMEHGTNSTSDILNIYQNQNLSGKMIWQEQQKYIKSILDNSQHLIKTPLLALSPPKQDTTPTKSKKKNSILGKRKFSSAFLKGKRSSHFFSNTQGCSAEVNEQRRQSIQQIYL